MFLDRIACYVDVAHELVERACGQITAGREADTARPDLAEASPGLGLYYALRISAVLRMASAISNTRLFWFMAVSRISA